MPNIFEPHFDEIREHPGFEFRRTRVGEHAGAERSGASVWELPPGPAAYPYQSHHSDKVACTNLCLRATAFWSSFGATMPLTTTKAKRRPRFEPAASAVGRLSGSAGAHSLSDRRPALGQWAAPGRTSPDS
jgi:hypothetical protein